VAQWADNRELFPRGIDLLLVADGQRDGLPRSHPHFGRTLICM
jgi:alpha-D-ribose 1-methylphosphonate 5-triphosphate synthase subunit PhnH